MARTASAQDAFTAVSEPRRRQILDALADEERPVNELVERVGLSQPLVSKHLRVLREVGLVQVRDAGRHRMYRVNALPLKPIHDWLTSYERTWSERFDRLDAVLADLQTQQPSADKENGDGSDQHP
jgi:DNA-binding transcriptional ArsR family regulator